jgi:hypothetical protein
MFGYRRELSIDITRKYVRVNWKHTLVRQCRVYSPTGSKKIKKANPSPGGNPSVSAARGGGSSIRTQPMLILCYRMYYNYR